ncbi:unnamed protein product [Rodentolepis nana]|uniref:BACK domain-containing protein n=1 Tax=Rodentolepis nana TaxID=102285 RepID=A0A0R3TVQ7_RODNA|nr:unnamed protein product [Rodentolepis nana]
MKLDSEKILDAIEMKKAKLDLIKRDIEKYEEQRLDIHAKFQEAEREGNEECLGELREVARSVRKEKNRLRELYRSVAFSEREELLQVPNKLRDVPRSLPDESWFNADVSLENRPGAISFFDVAGSTLNNSIVMLKADLWFHREDRRYLERNASTEFDILLFLRDCGTYLTGELVTMATDLMPNLLERLLDLVDVTRRSRCRLCSLSDFVRLPVVEACAWVSSLDKVIQMVHTKDDLYTLEDGGRVLINPYTRICLVGSASLASFVGSIFGSSLSIPEDGLNFLTLGNIYQYALQNGDTMSHYPFKQTRQISYFGLFPDKDASVRTFDKLAVIISKFWSDFQPHWKIKWDIELIETYLNFHFTKMRGSNWAEKRFTFLFACRLRVVEDADLRYCEMARWRVTMVSEDRSEFEVASLSLLGDWVSRRGGIRSSSDGAFPSMVFGEMVNLVNFIAAVLKEGVFQPSASK